MRVSKNIAVHHGTHDVVSMSFELKVHHVHIVDLHQQLYLNEHM